MKRIIILSILISAILANAIAQSIDPVSLVIEKLIKAIDLKVQAMQNAVMDLQVIQRKAENELSRKELDEIGSLNQKQKELYAIYYASLKQVKPDILSNRALSAVFERQKQLVTLYNQAIAANRQDKHLTEIEKARISIQYNTILAEAGCTINKLSETLKPNNIQATDAERLKLIGQAANQLEGLYFKIRASYARNMETSLQRAKDKDAIDRIRKLYPLAP